MILRPPSSTLFPYTTLFRSLQLAEWLGQPPAPAVCNFAKLAFEVGRTRQLQFHLGQPRVRPTRSEEHTSELQSLRHLVCRLLLEKKKTIHNSQRSVVLTPIE